MQNLNNLQKYLVIFLAKDDFDKKEMTYGMCRYLIHAARSLYPNVYKYRHVYLKDLKYFNRSFLNASTMAHSIYWWPLSERTERAAAFKTLRMIYEKLAKEDLLNGVIKLEDEEILDILIKARDNQEIAYKTSMCLSLQSVFCNKYHLRLSYKSIRELIPIFNPKFLGVGDIDPATYWWPENDKKSRLKAFDKMIKYYKRNEPILWAEVLGRTHIS